MNMNMKWAFRMKRSNKRYGTVHVNCDTIKWPPCVHLFRQKDINSIFFLVSFRDGLLLGTLRSEWVCVCVMKGDKLCTTTHSNEIGTDIGLEPVFHFFFLLISHFTCFFCFGSQITDNDNDINHTFADFSMIDHPTMACVASLNRISLK